MKHFTSYFQKGKSETCLVSNIHFGQHIRSTPLRVSLWAFPHPALFSFPGSGPSSSLPSPALLSTFRNAAMKSSHPD